MKPELGKQLLYLSRADVEAVNLPIAEIIAAVEDMFREKAAGRTEMPAKIGIHPLPDAFLHAMPAHIAQQKATGLKWVAGFPANSRRGFPYISGVVVLNDSETGLPLAIMDCTWITAMRTAAASAVAAKFLARPDSSVLGILGCGVQARSHIRALHHVFPLKEVRAYDIHPERGKLFANEVKAQFGINASPVEGPREAVMNCDLVVTAGPILRTPHATIQKDWLSAGSFASLVDYDSYWHADALRRADKFCTDDIPQLEHHRKLGYFQHIPPIYGELGELVSGKKAGRQNSRERTFACNLGLALDDMATAPLIYQQALAKQIGTVLPL